MLQEEEEKVGEEIKTEVKELETPERCEEAILRELESTKKQLDGEKEKYLRLYAEFDNFRKRILKEKEEFAKYANEKLILELIDIYESLGRGIETAKSMDNKDKLIEGMELIYKQFKSILEKIGLSPIKAVGEKFDPYRHEAMMQTVTNEYEDNTILEEFARGYMLNGKVIRYSKVRVSKKKEKEEVN